MLLGICSACVIVYFFGLPKFIKIKKQYILLAICFVITAVPVLIGKGSTIRIMAALAAANVFPAIGMISQLDVIRRNRLIGKLKIWSIIIKSSESYCLCKCCFYDGGNVLIWYFI